MKKVLALVVAFALVFSTVTVAFAEEPAVAKTDAEVCTDLGMLVGDGNGVTAEYLATAPTRLQAAVMFLRLKGLEAEAKAFTTGTANFADGNIAWAEGKNILSYLYAHPELGWIGDGTNFNPNALTDAKSYYKVLLEALGYKQTTAAVAGDFTWEGVLEFAATKGLVKVAAVTAYTVNDLATATVEALKLNVNGGTKTLAATLVEQGVIDKAKAIADGLYSDASTVSSVAMESAKAIGNVAVEVTFAADVEKAFAENADNYKIVEKGTENALEVKGAILDFSDRVVLETAAQTAGKAYTLKVGEVSVNFGGMSKVTGAPELDDVVGTDTERVEVSFDKVMDSASVLNPANYTIAGITVESVKWADDNRKVVELTTKGLVTYKSYKLTVTNVKSVDGVVLKSASDTFSAKSDKTAPELSDATKVDTNTRILVVFNEEVSKDSAENLDNYKLTVGSATATNTLEITAAKLVEDINDMNENDADDDMAVVELTTAAQKSSQKYVLHVNNIVDTAVLANKMTKEDTINVYGKKADTDEPTASSCNYTSDHTVKIVFSDNSRLDWATATDVANYTVNNDIAVQKAEMDDVDDPDCKTVILTVDKLGEKDSYKISVKNVADEYGNVMDDKTFTKYFDENEFKVPATIESIASTDLNTVVVTFTKELDDNTAEEVANYEIADLGTPTDASYDTTGEGANVKGVVELTVPDMDANEEYDLTVDSVEDVCGHVLADVEGSFVTSATELDMDAPEIDDIEAVSDTIVRVTYSESIDMDVAGQIYVVQNGEGIVGTATIGSDDDKVVDYLLDSATEEDDAHLYTVDNEDDHVVLPEGFEHVKDLAGNWCEDDEEFSASEDAQDPIELLSIEQVNAREFKLQYAEQIADPEDATIEQGAGVPYTLDIDVDDDDATIVYLDSRVAMAEDKDFAIDLADYLASFNGTVVENSNEDDEVTEFTTDVNDEDAPYIESVVATSSTEVVVTFNEDILDTAAGTYEISFTNEDDEDDVADNEVTDVDGAEVTLTIDDADALTADTVYTLSVVNQAKDLSGNKVDEDAEYEFEGSDVVAVGDYIEGVKILSGTKIQVVLSSDADVAEDSVDVSGVTTEENDAVADDNVVTVTVDNSDPFLADTEYTVTVGEATYTFTGIITDDISLDQVSDHVYSVTYDDMTDGDMVWFEGAEAGVEVEEESATVDFGAGGEYNVWVERNGVVLYFNPAEEIEPIPEV